MPIVVEGGYKLEGDISVAGAKNAALPILAATLLTTDECYLENLPDIEDIRTMTHLLRGLGASVETEGTHGVVVKADRLSQSSVPSDPATKMRASFLVVGFVNMVVIIFNHARDGNEFVTFVETNKPYALGVSSDGANLVKPGADDYPGGADEHKIVLIRYGF